MTSKPLIIQVSNMLHIFRDEILKFFSIKDNFILTNCIKSLLNLITKSVISNKVEKNYPGKKILLDFTKKIGKMKV